MARVPKLLRVTMKQATGLTPAQQKLQLGRLAAKTVSGAKPRSNKAIQYHIDKVTRRNPYFRKNPKEFLKVFQ